MPKVVLIVHSRPVEPSREDEFNKWYDEVHIPDVTSVLGRSQRPALQEGWWR